MQYLLLNFVCRCFRHIYWVFWCPYKAKLFPWEQWCYGPTFSMSKALVMFGLFSLFSFLTLPYGCAVKIVRDKESEESLGYGFIWFSGRESADLAVREMNGKVSDLPRWTFIILIRNQVCLCTSLLLEDFQFFHGRFILVTEAKPRLPQRQERTKPYRF